MEFCEFMGEDDGNCNNLERYENICYHKANNYAFGGDMMSRVFTDLIVHETKHGMNAPVRYEEGR